AVIGDILDADALRSACEGCDWVFHAAAIADYWRADQARMFEANVEGTRLILQAAQVAGVARVVFTSSAAAVGLRRNGALSDEAAPFNLPPRQFPYGYSKALAERVVAQAVLAGQDVVTLNPVMVLGPGDLNLISGSFILQTKQYGWLTPITAGGACVVDVRDVAGWHVAAAERGIAGERYILGATNIDYAAWFALIAETVGVRRPWLRVPSALLPIIANAIDLARRLGVDTPIDAAQTRLGGAYVYFAYDKAWAAFGAPQYALADTVRDTAAWYVAHGYMR
ncbi:MAG: NAD-dependent epimerase/dehydratase family protein, partial [Armatimonadetes bacterium]|nr:NAD-dependent epimerase/dehydratase family protein [Anaerolineae bacterium]